jgi:hypothetical protein
MMRFALGLALVAGAPGCAGFLKQSQLEKSAKDWCLVLRASQVLPVYPPTEDLQPGDVFLVRMPIADQAKQYEERGFLPLDLPVMRLSGIDYAKYYGDGYFDAGFDQVPHARPRAAGDGGAAVPTVAPRVAFPTYAFQVSSGAGLNLALPVQGVPVGLSLLRTDAASGSISIQDAFTYGASSKDLLLALEKWSLEPSARAHLIELAGSVKQTLYLRVVSRVYLAGAVDVTLSASGATDGKVDAGATGGGEADPLARVSAALKSTVGGSLTASAATERGLTLRERFDRPLVIGYLGFDVPIESDGSLGPPAPTLSLLEKRDVPPPARVGALDRSSRQLQFRRLELERLAGGANADPTRALAIVGDVAAGLPAEPFEAHAKKAKESQPAAAAEVVGGFWDALEEWTSQDGGSGRRFDVAIGLYDAAHAAARG